MSTPAQVVPGYYVWEITGKPVVIHLNLNVVDRLAAEIMRGYGSAPRRGAELGGVLVGTVEEDSEAPGKPIIIRVEDFTAVPCEHRRGPSYLLADDDGAVFEQAYTQPGVIGYFRSHTREGLSLATEDIELLDHFFPGQNNVALLVKPFATKACSGSFFIREDGAFASEPALEFPFRRRELMGEEAPPRRSMIERGPRRERPPASNAEAATDTRYAPGYSPNVFPQNINPQNERIDPVEPAYAYTNPARTRSQTWYWIPLSLIFLLLGLFLGFQVALSVGLRAAGSSAQDFSLALAVSKNGDNLNVKWDGKSAAVRASQKGTLEITDGGVTKPVDLDAAQLQNGALIYRGLSSSVQFRLSVHPNSRVSVTESVEWK